MINKARYWVGVLYPENMLDDWEQEIGDIVQVPYAYCIHNADLDGKEDERKTHVHLILVFTNTTTYNHAMQVYSLLSKPNCQAINTCQAIVNIRAKYDYLIHDTDTARKQGKEPYDPSCRITGNNFDIGAYEQLGVAEKSEMTKFLIDKIVELGFCNMIDFYMYCQENILPENSAYFEIIETRSATLERFLKGNYQKFGVKNTQKHTKNTLKTHQKICPNCGSDDYVGNGVTVDNKPRFRCKDCGKSWSEK